jgi:hypothetical protein
MYSIINIAKSVRKDVKLKSSIGFSNYYTISILIILEITLEAFAFIISGELFSFTSRVPRERSQNPGYWIAYVVMVDYIWLKL